MAKKDLNNFRAEKPIGRTLTSTSQGWRFESSNSFLHLVSLNGKKGNKPLSEKRSPLAE
jgi:hypothetical protein